MAEVTLIQCDNPLCKKMGQSESDPPPPKGSKKALLPPYAWVVLSGSFFGCGPDFKNVVTCSVECVESAIREAVRQANER